MGVASTLCRLALYISLLTALAPLAHAGNYLVHRNCYLDDGDTLLDGNRTRDSVIIWNPGKIHIVVGRYAVADRFTLIIKPGAIVKFATTFDYDYESGSLRSWTPPQDVGIECYPATFYTMPGNLIIDGATLTDVRDDTEGGDSNGDADSTSPTKPFTSSMFIAFSNSPDDELKNSRVKYFNKIGRLGSMTITDNHFIALGCFDPAGQYPLDMDPSNPNAAPEITGNTFELNQNGFLDLRGTAPIFESNTVKYVDNAVTPAGVAVYIGLKHVESGVQGPVDIGPHGGIARVSNNTIIGGIEISSYDSDSLSIKEPFAAEICNNHLICPQGIGGVGIRLKLSSAATVAGNLVEGFVWPLVVLHEQHEVGLLRDCQLQIHNNRFMPRAESQLYGIADTFWHQGMRVHAENNYWGDPSGPHDTSTADGISNARGKGMTIVGNGISYIPFIGGATPRQLDAVQIAASTQPATLAPGGAATVTVNVTTLQLRSSTAGAITVNIRDAMGNPLNDPGTTVRITSSSSSVTIPPIAIAVPEMTSGITVEAEIVPDGYDPVSSNTLSFPVPQPPNAFTFYGLYDPATGMPLLPNIVPGASISGRADFNYTHTTGNVDFAIRIVLRDKRGAVLGDLLNTTLSVPPGSNVSTSKLLSLQIPIIDITQHPACELYGTVVATDERGKTIGHAEAPYPLFLGVNSVRFKTVKTIEVIGGGPVPFGRDFYVTGEQLIFSIKLDYRAGSPNASGWLISLRARALDARGTIVQEWPSQVPFAGGITTASSTAEISKVVGSRQESPTIPASARRVRLYAQLTSSSGVITAIDSMDFDVHAPPDLDQTVTAASGASQVSFAPIPITAAITTTSGAAVTALEFHGAFARAERSSNVPFITSRPNEYWQFTPLNRWWAVFDTMPAGSITGTLSITYDPSTDFPGGGLTEDSLVICGYNYASRSLEALPTTLATATHTVTTPWNDAFDTYVVAAKLTRIDDAVAEHETPGRITMGANYPNPAHDRTTLTFDCWTGGHVQCDIYNALGTRVASLSTVAMNSGTQTLEWDAGHQPRGIYLCVLRIAGEVATRPVVVQ